jgi:hypothetical protein
MEQPRLKQIELTTKQVEELRDFYNFVDQEFQEGRRGVLVAQIGYQDRRLMSVAFMPHDVANETVGRLKELGYRS